MQITKDNPTSLLVDIESEFTQNFSIMLMSDVHFDSTVCDLSLFHKHLKYAESHQMPILVAGDLLDAMQGKYDPRRTPEDLKQQYAVNAYYDALVIDVARYLAEYNIPGYILCDGNHETSVRDHSGTDLLHNVAYQLRVEHKKNAVHMGYWGYVDYRFHYNKGNAMASYLQYFHHGNGYSAPVTKSTIHINRQSVWLTDVNLVHNGHTHDCYAIPQPIEKYNKKAHKPYQDTVWFIRTPGYKMSPTTSHKTGGFESEHFRGPKSRGCHVLNLTYSHNDDSIEAEILQKIQ